MKITLQKYQVQFNIFPEGPEIKIPVHNFKQYALELVNRLCWIYLEHITRKNLHFSYYVNVEKNQKTHVYLTKEQIPFTFNVHRSYWAAGHILRVMAEEQLHGGYLSFYEFGNYETIENHFEDWSTLFVPTIVEDFYLMVCIYCLKDNATLF